MMHGLTGNEPFVLFPWNLTGNLQDTDFILFFSVYIYIYIYSDKNLISFKIRFV